MDRLDVVRALRFSAKVIQIEAHEPRYVICLVECIFTQQGILKATTVYLY